MLEYRSAMNDYPAPSVPDRPTVGIVVPVYNEIAHLDGLVDDVLGQNYPAITEIVFVDGRSTDGTFEKLLNLQERDGRIRVISNPRRIPAAALNIAFATIEADIVVRLDAHAIYQADVVAKSVETLLKTGAGGVGPIQRPAAAESVKGQAIVAAHKSRLGVGAAKFRQEGAEGWVDSVWNGCYWKHVIEQVGCVREDLWRAEDNDFNARVRQLGYGLYVSPEIYAYYKPRETFAGLWRQYFSNGVGIVFALFTNPGAVSFRHMLPVTFVVSLLMAVVASVAWPPVLMGAAAILLAYVAALVLGTLLMAKSEIGIHLFLLPVALATLHFSYGLGALWGLIRRTLGARAAGGSIVPVDATKL